MSTALADVIKDEIARSGSMDIGRFMMLALGHREYGYYMTRDPFGKAGDFVTAPEISQVFGELLGLWLADIWMQMGAPAKVFLVECGPGRGTLMADIMRVVKGVEGFYEALHVYLIEMSPVLKQKQQEVLKEHGRIKWCKDIESVPVDAPVLLIGNEFLDALPVRQAMRSDKGWQERVVACKDGAFCFDFKKADEDLHYFLPSKTQSYAIYELSPARLSFIERCCEVLKRARGAALFIDYGYIKRAAGDTLQALYRHEPSDVFTRVGQSDLTAHVDFEVLCDGARAHEGRLFGLETQGVFLQRLGILYRAQALMELAQGDEVKAKNIESCVHRLVAPSEMGDLFKVMGFGYGYDFKASGF